MLDTHKQKNLNELSGIKTKENLEEEHHTQHYDSKESNFLETKENVSQT
jgi:hypothetical protein